MCSAANLSVGISTRWGLHGDIRTSGVARVVRTRNWPAVMSKNGRSSRKDPLGKVLDELVGNTDHDPDSTERPAPPPRPEERKIPQGPARAKPAVPARTRTYEHDTHESKKPTVAKNEGQAGEIRQRRQSEITVEHEGRGSEPTTRRQPLHRPQLPTEPPRGRQDVPTDAPPNQDAMPAARVARSRPTLPSTADDTHVAAAADPRTTAAQGSVAPLVIEASAFGSAPWWSRGWWRLPPSGRARDVSSDAGTVGSMAVLGTSLRGNKHRLDAAPNDDAFALRTARTADGAEWVIGCVCDGVGSAERAHEGSAFVAEYAADALAEAWARFDAPIESPLSMSTSGAIDSAIAGAPTALAHHFGLDPTDTEVRRVFETTITFAVVAAASDPDGTRPAVVGHIGDSPALLLSDGTWSDLFAASGDESTGVTSTRTAGVLTSDGPVETRFLGLEAQDVLMLCSDGVGAFMTDGEFNLRLGQVLAERLAGPVDVLEATNLLSFDMRSADDDRTALIMWQLHSTSRSSEEAVK